MKVLFAVNDDNISESIIKKYQSVYKEVISGKNVYYFNAIIKELQKDKTYDRIVISEDLEPITNKNYDTIDNFMFEKLDKVSDEATTSVGEDIPIILIATDRRKYGDPLLSKIFGIGIYNALVGNDRSITELCNLINKPRTKKAAKTYYRVDIADVDYKAESEDAVSEEEIQSILTYYKRTGKNEDKYIEVFNKIASQYSDEQLKVIIKFLPIGVKAVLEARSPKYQQIATFSGESKVLKKQKPYDSTQINPKTKKPRCTSNAIVDNGVAIEAIHNTQSKKLSKPVIIPSNLSTSNVKKIEVRRKSSDMMSDNENVNNQVQEVKRGRGRPRKVVPGDANANVKANVKKQVQEVEDVQIDDIINSIEANIEKQGNIIANEPPKKKRGRPRKVDPELVNQSSRVEEETVLPGFDDIEETEETVLPGFDEIDEVENVKPVQSNNNIRQVKQSHEKEEDDEFLDFDDDYEDYSVLPGFDIEEDNMLNFDDQVRSEDIKRIKPKTSNISAPQSKIEKYHLETEEDEEYDDTINTQQLQQTPETNYSSVTNLYTSDAKIISFVGTQKNGTSFLVNNVADILSRQGIRTAILDLTKNKNTYYIYTKNEEELRKVAMKSITKLLQGVAEGVHVNRNLDVYTALPGDGVDTNNYGKILETLSQAYSLILIDCDFDTNYGYIKESHELYLVQSMDVLTIQPLTAYLRDLKAKNALDQNKLRIVINKCTRVRSVTERTIIGGMAFYNDPSMSFMTELFNRETVKYTVVPFDVQTYSKYLEGLINCNITINGYSKDSIAYLNKLATMIYPVVSSPQQKYNNSNYNSYTANNYNTRMNSFSQSINNTINKMRGKY